MSLLNQIGNLGSKPVKEFNSGVIENQENLLESSKEETKKIIEEIIDYGVVNKTNYFVLREKRNMSDLEILEYIKSFHKDLGLDWMIDHIISKVK